MRHHGQYLYRYTHADIHARHGHIAAVIHARSWTTSQLFYMRAQGQHRCNNTCGLMETIAYVYLRAREQHRSYYTNEINDNIVVVIHARS